MKIEVTKKHIQNGIRKDACHCPIGLAIHDALNIKWVAVCKNWIDLETSSTRIHTHGESYKKFRTFIRDFDDGIPVSPFSFELEGISCQN